MGLKKKQQLALNEIKKGNNVFISGPGGVGKSFLINKLREEFGNNTIFLAPTGIAAINIEGATIHSTFGFEFGVLGEKQYNKVKEKPYELFENPQTIKRIVIDEISMVRVDVFKAIDRQLKHIRKTKKPFGGIQMIVVGDFFQIPPVLVPKEQVAFEKHGFDSIFCFSDDTWKEANFKTIELDEIVRQDDETLVSHLQNMRSKNGDYHSSIDYFNERVKKPKIDSNNEKPIYLCTTNNTADRINEKEFSKLNSKKFKYYASKFDQIKINPAPYELELKVGTKVLILANTQEYKNGEVGIVTRLTSNTITVEINDIEHDIERYTWHEYDYVILDGQLTKIKTGSFTQYPLKYAWAITIHKSQGKTLDSAVISLGNGCFVSGQLYVALSRVRSIDGLYLKRPIYNNDLITSSEVKEFYEKNEQSSGLRKFFDRFIS
tara:strand:+ start:871 stop:2172 length:1302 start_codon:yes stop_codon:yes gene_type:complete